MKEAIIIGLDGFYVEPVIVPSTEQGITEIYETPQPTEETPEPEPILFGYRVAVSVTPGLYKPRYDISARQNALDAYDVELDAYNAALADWYVNGEVGEKPVPPTPVDETQFWVEGLTQEELDVINPPITLDDIKNEKIKELRVARDNELYAGFSTTIASTPLFFGFDPIDQNYISEKALLMTIDESVENVDWKVSLDGVNFTMYTLSREEFFQVVKDAGAFKEGLVRDLMYLEAMVMNCETEEDVDAISWST